MRFETAQVLDIAGISKETLRHWKKVLSPIRERDGRSHRYGFSELVTLCVIARATLDLAIPIGRFAADAQWLFEELEKQTGPGGTPTTLIILGNRMTLGDENELADAETVSMVRIPHVINRVRSQIMNDSPSSPQLVLPF